MANSFLEKRKALEELWIAFKLVILSYGKQQVLTNGTNTLCCELLSN